MYNKPAFFLNTIIFKVAKKKVEFTWHFFSQYFRISILKHSASIVSQIKSIAVIRGEKKEIIIPMQISLIHVLNKFRSTYSIVPHVKSSQFRFKMQGIKKAVEEDSNKISTKSLQLLSKTKLRKLGVVKKGKNRSLVYKTRKSHFQIHCINYLPNPAAFKSRR